MNIPCTHKEHQSVFCTPRTLRITDTSAGVPPLPVNRTVVIGGHRRGWVSVYYPTPSRRMEVR